ncbi:carboxylesterase family protein [Alteromonas sp. NFXS44]
MSEDCLSLNIWMPSTRSDNKVPVLVWIHGGAFIGGAGGIDIYHGDKLAEQGVNEPAQLGRAISRCCKYSGLPVRLRTARSA